MLFKFLNKSYFSGLKLLFAVTKSKLIPSFNYTNMYNICYDIILIKYIPSSRFVILFFESNNKSYRTLAHCCESLVARLLFQVNESSV